MLRIAADYERLGARCHRIVIEQNDCAKGNCKNSQAFDWTAAAARLASTPMSPRRLFTAAAILLCVGALLFVVAHYPLRTHAISIFTTR
jgi:hypothetical protein